MEEEYDGQEVRRFPCISAALAGVNIILFFLLALGGDTEDADYLLAHGAMYPKAVLAGEWYRLFTCMFLHFNIEHLMNNMLMLVAAGMHLEYAMGGAKYLLLYLLSGLGGSLLSFGAMCKSGEMAVSAGASGAVFGIIGALLWVAIRNHGRFERLTTKGVLLMIALSLYFGFTGTEIDNWGHIGGMAAGFILSVLFYRKRTCADASDKLY